MTRSIAVLLAALGLLPISAATAQTCTEPHYRWSEKVDTAFAHQTPTAVDVSDILAWPARTIKAKDKCASRIGRERKVYSVTAWVRRIKTRETDGDWHIEVTEEEDTDVPASCIIVEIPAKTFGDLYGQARDQLAGLVDTTHLGTGDDLNTPVQVTFTGAAFFDGYHQKKTATGSRASQHGRCNSSVHALWDPSGLRSENACRSVARGDLKQQGAAVDQSAAPMPPLPSATSTSRRLRLTTTGARLGLVLGLERAEDVAGTRPRRHELRLVPKPEPHETIERPNLYLDLARHRFEIGARTHMPAPAFPRRLERLLELAHGIRQRIHQGRRHPMIQQGILVLRRLPQHPARRLDQCLVTGIAGRQPELVRQLDIVLRRDLAHCPQIQEQFALQLAA